MYEALILDLQERLENFQTDGFSLDYCRIRGACEAMEAMNEKLAALQSENAELREKLKVYEDTGLEPCDYAAMRAALEREAKAQADLTVAIMILGAYRALGPVEELETLVKARDEGRVVVLPEVSEQDRKGMADFLHDCFAEWIHDPSVGLFGMTEGEAALANAIMTALTRAEAEAAIGGGVDGL